MLVLGTTITITIGITLTTTFITTFTSRGLVLELVYFSLNSTIRCRNDLKNE